MTHWHLIVAMFVQHVVVFPSYAGIDPVKRSCHGLTSEVSAADARPPVVSAAAAARAVTTATLAIIVLD